MKQYNHTKEVLATAVARNLSRFVKEPVYVYVAGIKSIPSMKYIDTTVIQVIKHSELPNPARTAIIKTMFHKGKESKNF